MQQIKRQRSTCFNNYDMKRKQLQITTFETNFEDLSNELIYEILEFLDYFHVYKAFFNLNLRFRSLVTNSTLPIKINLTSMSKIALYGYYKDIIIRNKHRINSLRVSNFFMYYDPAFPLFRRISTFHQLETLILEHTESYYLENLLHQLTSLPRLTSLIITSIFNRVKSTNNIYRQVFQLPALKYCNLSLQTSESSEPLPIATNEYSPIEYLVIKNNVYCRQIHSLLTHMPQLRRLSLQSLFHPWNVQTTICPTILNHLTHLSLNLDTIQFYQLEQWVISLFRSVKVLHVSANAEYIDANRWKQLILFHLPDLRIFDILLNVYARSKNDQLRIKDQINQFTSPFWMERQWFFEHRYCPSSFPNLGIFYSTNPYRRKHYKLYKQQNKTICLSGSVTDLKSVDNIQIRSTKEIINCMYYFPNVTKLTFESSVFSNYDSIETNLTNIILLKKLTKLVIECNHLSFKKMIELLQFTPNIHTLIFASMGFDKTYFSSLRQNEIFQLVSNTNTIINVTLEEECSLEKLKLLVALCPRVQNLTINIALKDMKSIAHFLLNKPNSTVCHLVLLCFSDACTDYSRNLEALITSRTLLGDYMLRLVGAKLYLWW